MSSHKRATTQEAGPAAPERQTAVDIVYLGLTRRAQREEAVDPPALEVGESFRLSRGAAIAIGRSEDADITIDGPDLGEAHAALAFIPGASLVALLDLEGGTSDDEPRTSVQYLEQGAEFEIAGTYRFRCQPVG